MKKVFCSIIAILFVFSAVAFAAINAMEFTAVNILAPAVRASTATGAEVLNNSYTGIGMAILTHSASGGAGITSTVKLQNSTDNASWADITGGAFAAAGNVAGIKIIGVDLDKAKRYLRAVDTVAGGNCTGALGVVLIAKPKYQ